MTIGKGTLIILATVLAAAVTFLVALRNRRATFLTAENHRGERIPVVLGIAITAGLMVGVLSVLVADFRNHRVVPTAKGTAEILGGILLVFLAGLQDDARPTRTHGLVWHFQQLARGRLTPGIVKLAVSVLAAAVFLLATRQHGLRLALGIPFVAGAANLWNLMDVAPGRAIKFFLPVSGVALGLAPGRGFAVFEWAAIAAALAALPFDLGEVAMLGDSGAYVLGFVAGSALFLRLSTPGVAIALALVVLLHALAETVTLSRLVSAFPPLRWFDRLGRLREEGRATEEPSPAR